MLQGQEVQLLIIHLHYNQLKSVVELQVYYNINSNSYWIINVADDDFSSASQTFVFRANETRVCRNFSLIDDNIALEGNETFNVVLSSTTSGIIGSQNTGVVTIIDNDGNIYLML